MKVDILAAIDIGSNAVRLLINYAEVDGTAYELRKAAYLRVPIRLGEDVFACSRVSEAKTERLVEAIQGFGHLMRAYPVSSFRACATSAMRDAENGQAILAAIKANSGINIEIIGGKEEANLIYMAGAHKGLPQNGATLSVDVGGGSTELVLYESSHLLLHESFQIGTVRMLSDTSRTIARGLRTEQGRFARTLQAIHDRYAPKRIIASGGNINKIGKLLTKKNDDPVRCGDLKDLLDKLKPLSIAERMHRFGLKDYRADVIVPALEIFLSICKECPSIQWIHIPRIGLTDGLIQDMFEKRLANGVYA